MSAPEREAIDAILDDLELEEPEPRSTMLDRLLYGRQVCDLPAPEPLVEGFLNLDSLAVIYGRPKAGKSFVMLDLALSVATGSWWHGHRVEAGTVLYVVAEGARGTGPRMDAWLERHGIHSDPTRFVVYPSRVNLLDAAEVAELLAVVDHLEPRLIVFDTLNRCMPGGDENSGVDMGRIIATADHLKQRTGACVAFVHHSGKDTGKGSRGHSSLLGAVDSELEVLNAGDGIATVRTTAQKDMAEAPPLRLGLEAVGESLVVVDYSGSLVDTDAVTRHGRVCVEVLDRIAGLDGIATSIWREAVGEEGVSRSSFYAQVKRLEGLGQVENVGTTRAQRWRLTDGD